MDQEAADVKQQHGDRVGQPMLLALLAGDGHENAAEEQAPQAAPECAVLAPKFDPIAQVVESYDLFLAVIALTDKGEHLHIETGLGQFLQPHLSALMIVEDGNDGVILGHLFLRCGSRRDWRTFCDKSEKLN